MNIKGWTLEELANKLGMSKNSTQKRIGRFGIAAEFTGSIYPEDTYDKVKIKKTGAKNPKKP